MPQPTSWQTGGMLDQEADFDRQPPGSQSLDKCISPDRRHPHKLREIFIHITTEKTEVLCSLSEEHGRVDRKRHNVKPLLLWPIPGSPNPSVIVKQTVGVRQETHQRATHFFTWSKKN